MYKCLDCGRLFEEPAVWSEEEPKGCPECGGTYGEAYQCVDCQEWYTADEAYYAGYCYNCAKQQYSKDLGLEYVAKDPYDFYCKYIWGVDNQDPELMRILKEAFLSYWTADKEELLREYCLEEMEYWIEYLQEKGSRNELNRQTA